MKKMPGQSQVCEKQSSFQAVLQTINSLSGGGWGTLAQRTPTTSASQHSRHCNPVVRTEGRAKFRSRPTWCGKSQVGQHNSGIPLAHQYQMHGLPQSFQCKVLSILGCYSTVFQHIGFQGQLLKYHSKPSKKIQLRPSLGHINDPMPPERHQLFADLSHLSSFVAPKERASPKEESAFIKKQMFRSTLKAIETIQPHSWPPK